MEEFGKVGVEVSRGYDASVEDRRDGYVKFEGTVGDLGGAGGGVDGGRRDCESVVESRGVGTGTGGDQVVVRIECFVFCVSGRQ
jgi:hypothetical protein